ILYELLSGQRAFGGPSAVETMNAILKEDPPALTESRRAIPPGLARIVERCLEKNPDERFHSAHDLAFALEAVAGSSSQSGAAAAVLPARRRALPPWAMALAAAAAIVVAFVLGRRTALSTAP